MSDQIAVPAISAFMDIVDDSTAIPHNERGRKKRISTNIILPPFLGALAMDLLHSHERIDPRALLTLVVSTIKAKFIDVDTPPSDDEKEAIFAKFDPLLIFLWVVSCDSKKAEDATHSIAQNTSVAESEALFHWSHERH